MAKHTVEAAPAPPKMEPQAHLSWPKEGVKLSGDYQALALDKRARIIVEGTVKGFSLGEYGCSVDLKVKTVRVDGIGEKEPEEEEGPSMAESIRRMKGGEKRKTKKE